jgi:hypothetical protein
MGYNFTNNDINKISRILQANAKSSANNYTWHVKNQEDRRSFILTLHDNINLGKSCKGSMISVQTSYGFFELHDCIGFTIFEPEEIIFIQQKNETISCLLVGCNGTCSMFANVRKEILNTDFNSLDPPVLLSAMQLSLTEDVLPES